MKATAAESTQAILDLPLLALDAHPKNTHGEVAEENAKLQELRASIEAIGQTDPCLVRPKGGDRYEVLSGHLRVQARTLLGLDTVPCVVRDVDDATALTILLVSNEKEPTDPLLEADAIADLLAKKSGDLREVARLLGKTVRHVAARANLRTLHPNVRKLWSTGKLERWEISWLELVARLSDERQAQLADPRNDTWRRLDRIRDRQALDELLGDCFRELGKAPWKLDDGALVPAAGACATCPKTSLRAPGLFDDGDLDAEDPKAIKKAVCRDSSCWDKKKAASTSIKLDELREQHPEAPIVNRDYVRDVALPAGAKVVHGIDARDVKKGDKGAKPAILLTESGPKLGYVKLDTSLGSSARSAAKKDKKAEGEKDPKKRLAESKEAIGRRRRAFVVDEIRARIEKLKDLPSPPKVPAGVVLALAAAYSVSAPGETYHYAAPKVRKKIYDQVVGTEDLLAQALWPRIRDNVADTFKRHNPANLDEEHAAATWVGELLGIALPEIVEKAIAEIPDPKWWGAHDKVPAKKAAEVVEGMCRGCGCTHDRACASGCSWVEVPDANALQKKDWKGRYLSLGLCSSCAGSQPKGKKAPKKKKARGSS